MFSNCARSYKSSSLVEELVDRYVTRNRPTVIIMSGFESCNKTLACTCLFYGSHINIKEIQNVFVTGFEPAATKNTCDSGNRCTASAI